MQLLKNFSFRETFRGGNLHGRKLSGLGVHQGKTLRGGILLGGKFSGGEFSYGGCSLEENFFPNSGGGGILSHPHTTPENRFLANFSALKPLIPGVPRFGNWVKCSQHLLMPISCAESWLQGIFTEMYLTIFSFSYSFTNSKIISNTLFRAVVCKHRICKRMLETWAHSETDNDYELEIIEQLS